MIQRAFPLARLDIITIVVSHTETVPPFKVLRFSERFRESVCCVRLRWFFEHSQLSLLMFRLNLQQSRFNELERTAPLSLDDARELLSNRFSIGARPAFPSCWCNASSPQRSTRFFCSITFDTSDFL